MHHASIVSLFKELQGIPSLDYFSFDLSGRHILVAPLPQPRSISQNPGKTKVFMVLPLMAALRPLLRIELITEFPPYIYVISYC